VVEGEVRTCSENDRVEWVVPAAIPWEELAFPSTKAALRDFLTGRPRRQAPPASRTIPRE
jgi:hypothetical protein